MLFRSAEVLLIAARTGEDVSEMDVLKDYESARRNHNLMMMQTMDAFYRVFSNDIAPLKLLRNIGLGVAERLGPAKGKVMSFAMGLEGPMPALARKEPIVVSD